MRTFTEVEATFHTTNIYPTHRRYQIYFCQLMLKLIELTSKSQWCHVF